MKEILRVALELSLVLAVMLTACSASTATPPAALTETPAAAQNDFSPSPSIIVASAEVVPARHAQMSFAIFGRVKETLVHEGDVVKTGQTLITLDAPDLELSVTQAELKLKSAQLEWTYWIPPRKDRPPERRELAWAEVVQAQNELETAKAALAQATLTAPFDGTVVSIDIQPGESAQPGKTVITLGDLANMQIETTDLSERDVPHVKIGQSARVYIEALDKTVSGRVVSISPMAERVGGDTVYKALIHLSEQPRGLRWGMSATVEIQTE